MKSNGYISYNASTSHLYSPIKNQLSILVELLVAF